MYFAHLLPPAKVARIVEQMIAQWEPLEAELDGYVRADCAEMTPGMRFAAGYGRAVVGAALAYARANKEQLVEAVAEGGEPRPVALAGD
jgi:hypothetical protein